MIHEVTKQYLQGYLLAAQDDGCIKLPNDFMEKDMDWLSAKASEAEWNAKTKMLNGEILPSELKPKTTED